ncbi:rhomboid protease GluP [Bacillus horti]|uniref:Rhomboid protease GluP n=1 Tax=Caldalkalibacillus horti TaxID=77523 RepID=A0ABT9W3H4_9BACI|nr:rhomboid protease GluP [Bacillus horti]
MRDKWLWAYVLRLMKEEDYQLIKFPVEEQKQQLQSNEQENTVTSAVLLRNDGRSFQMLRLQAVDSVWGATLNRDIRSLSDQAKEIKKRLKAKELSILNVYVFPYEKDAYLLEPIEKLNRLTEDKITVISNAVFIDTEQSLTEWGIPQNDLASFGLNTEQDKINLQRLEWISTEEILKEVKAEEKKKEKEFHSTFNYGKPKFTYLFLIINFIIFAFIEWQGSSTDPETLIQYGAKWAPAILEGEYWRFITPVFLHIGFIHILMNSLALYFLGNLVEKIYGSFRFLWIYLFAGFTGTVASFVFSSNISAGASGAIFGCFGALLYFGLQRRNLFFRTLGNDVIIILIFNLGIGFIVPVVDNYGHIGGLVGGFLAAMIVSLPAQNKKRLEKIASGLVAIVLVVSMLGIGFTKDHEDDVALLIQATIEINQENYTEARDLLERAIELGDQRPEVFLQLGAVYNQVEQFDEAIEVFNRALDGGATQPELYFQLAYAQLKLGDYENGEKNLLETIYRDPDIVEAYYNLTLIYIDQEEYEKAFEVLDRAAEREITDERTDELYERLNDFYEELQNGA